ncbi:NUDIX domain-containing protein [Brevibacillus laterosporus]|uniref:NUDIX domain-containing protein n=1 Tax=Brevibacillus laterosporus TaxID=1465 RepID=UPI001EF2959E|nr:NUDIX domain-containing protein [Brevibacillus laterosporus]MCG7318670.1 NUDIX domain-containing protein [Brevibacillus laterosporus]MED1789956.1 NUDIX domain-containing protein [Brevibacillus laterosporus]
MSKMDEQILVVKRTNLFDNEKLVFQGIDKEPDRITKLMSNISTHYTVMRRGDAEEDPSFKQPIPYVVIRKGNELFMYKRLSGGGEARLHDKLSLGTGGHMNDEDTNSFEEVLEMNLLRELEEELDIQAAEREFNTIGFINDDLEEVGKVHIGLLVTLDLDENAIVNVREIEQLEGKWTTIEELLQPDTYERLESWSKFVVDVLK